jgi:hypothetical protein
VETISMVKYLRQEARSLPWGSTVLLISAQPDQALMAALLDLKRVGRSVTMVTIGGAQKELDTIQTGHLTVFNVSDEAAWNVVKEIGLKDLAEVQNG